MYTPVLAIHSKHFVLAYAIDIGLGRMQRNFEPMRKQVEGRRKSQLTDDSRSCRSVIAVFTFPIPNARIVGISPSLHAFNGFTTLLGSGIRTECFVLACREKSLPFLRQSAGKPCNRSLGAPLAHIEGSIYLGPRKPVTPQRSHTVSVNVGAGPSKLLALGARIAQTRPGRAPG